jgi:hypothetical protein
MKKYFFYILFLCFLFSCQKDLQNSSSESGVGGSLARFAIVGNKMYVVTIDQLKTFDISNPKQLKALDTVQLRSIGDIETIFSFDKNLFIGSRSALHIYKIDTNGVPRFGSVAQHSWGCDPVVANDSFAFVTTRNGGSSCRSQNNSFANQLIVYDVKDIQNPKLLTIVNMTFPNGVGLDKNLLFVCDDGVKMYDVSQAAKPVLRKHINNVDANDVIPLNGQLLVVGSNKITQLNYKDTADIKLISEFNLRK